MTCQNHWPIVEDIQAISHFHLGLSSVAWRHKGNLWLVHSVTHQAEVITPKRMTLKHQTHTPFLMRYLKVSSLPALMAACSGVCRLLSWHMKVRSG